MGTLTVAPLVLALWERGGPTAPARLVERVALGGAQVGLTAAAFGPMPGRAAPFDLAGLVPLVAVALVRLPRAGAALVVAAALPLGAAWGTLAGQGLFVLPGTAP